MPKATLQQVNTILDSISTQTQHPNLTATNNFKINSNLLKNTNTKILQATEELQQARLKNKLSSCLYGLKKISQSLKSNSNLQIMQNIQTKSNMDQSRHTYLMMRDGIKQEQFGKSHFYQNKNYDSKCKLPTILQSRSIPHLKTYSPLQPYTKLYLKNRNTHLNDNSLINTNKQSPTNRSLEHYPTSTLTSFITNKNKQNQSSPINKPNLMTSFQAINQSKTTPQLQNDKSRMYFYNKTDAISFLNRTQEKNSMSRSPQVNNRSYSYKLQAINSNNRKTHNTRPKNKKHLYESASGKALPKQHQFFIDRHPNISPKEISKLGLYQSTNRFRKQLISQQMMNMSPSVQKKFIEQIEDCKQNQLFLTRPKQLQLQQMQNFLKQQFAMISDVRENNNNNQSSTQNQQQNSLKQGSKQAKVINILNNMNDKNNGKNIKSMRQHTTSTTKEELLKYQNDSQEQSMMQQQQHLFIDDQQQNEPNNIEIDQTKPITKIRPISFLQIKNYILIKNQSYLLFKTQHIDIWEQIQTLLQQLTKFLSENKISYWKFKADNLLQFWDGKKLSLKDIEKILKLNHKQLPGSKNSALKNVIRIMKAKRFTKSIVDKKLKHQAYMRWVVDRIKGHTLIKNQTKYKLQKAYDFNQELLKGDYDWSVQIYIASFSQNQFVRSTTQYMESFQNMFTHMWRQSSKEMILVIPTVNAELLQVYQQKLKIKRSITIICPQVHELFPENISLAGCLLFSYQALNKIKRLIEGKNAVIIPGKFTQEPKYELLISQYLRTPLMTSLKPNRSFQAQRVLFKQAQLSVFAYTYIPPKSHQNNLLAKFAQLILQNKQTTQWILKINGEFSGRGLAMFSTKSSKVLRSILSSCKQTTKPLQQYLRRNLQLKLKVNFQNSLFISGDYMSRLAEKGGIIEEEKEAVESYQVSFFIESKTTSYVISCYKCYSTNYSNKAYIYEPIPSGQISQCLIKLKSALSINDYLGYVSVNMMVCGNQVYGVEIKPYLTHLCAVEPFIKAIESRRQLKLNLELQSKSQNKQLNTNTETLRSDPTSNRQNPQIIKQRNSSKFNLQSNNSNKIVQETKNNNNTLLRNMAVISLIENDVQVNPYSEFNYLFIPNIIMTDVPLTKKAEFIQSLVLESWTRNKFNVLDNNLVLYLSNGLGLSILVVGKEHSKIKKLAIDTVRMLSQKVSALKIYCGKNLPRDVFQFGDVIKALTQIK